MNYYTKAYFQLDLLSEENCKDFESVLAGYDALQSELDLVGVQLKRLTEVSTHAIYSKIIELYEQETLTKFSYSEASIMLFHQAGYPSETLVCSHSSPHSPTVLVFDYDKTVPIGLDILLQYAVKTYNIPPFGFCYSNTADRATTGAYGGGACWITAESIEWLDAHNWLEEKAKQ